MAVEVIEIGTLEGSAAGWIQTIVSWLEECERTSKNIQYKDVTYFNACAYPDLWERAIAPVWDEIKDKLSFQMSMCLEVVCINSALQAMFCCVAVLTFVVHILGFVLLVLDKGSGTSLLFGASFLVPTSLLVAFLRTWFSNFDTGLRPIAVGIYGFLNICGLVSLTAILDANQLLQANVILVTTTNLIPVLLRLLKSSKVFEKTRPNLERGHSQPSSPVTMQLSKWDTRSASLGQHTRKSEESHLPSPLLPPAPKYSTPSQQPTYERNSTTVSASPSADAGAVHVTTEMHVTVSAKQDDDLPELETWISSGVCEGCESWV
ncbi:hypothetical protein E8E11_001369 [Didymella keratinophila]|nr:hypothetical protein E8E11_001369 [Didymella keratinophila]